MSLAELLPEVKALSFDDKKQLMKAIEQDLEAQELQNLFLPGQTIEIWSPHDSYEAAVIMQRVLDEDKAKTP